MAAVLCAKIAAAFLVMPGTRYTNRIIDGASATAKKRLQDAIGTAGAHVKAELNAVDALHPAHGAAVCLVCAALEITHRAPPCGWRRHIRGFNGCHGGTGA